MTMESFLATTSLSAKQWLFLKTTAWMQAVRSTQSAMHHHSFAIQKLALLTRSWFRSTR
ncbi:hypothetical protein OSTOST_01472 [Ostertagia ostertagi]